MWLTVSQWFQAINYSKSLLGRICVEDYIFEFQYCNSNWSVPWNNEPLGWSKSRLGYLTLRSDSNLYYLVRRILENTEKNPRNQWKDCEGSNYRSTNISSKPKKSTHIWWASCSRNWNTNALFCHLWSTTTALNALQNLLDFVGDLQHIFNLCLQTPLEGVALRVFFLAHNGHKCTGYY